MKEITLEYLTSLSASSQRTVGKSENLFDLCSFSQTFTVEWMTQINWERVKDVIEPLSKKKLGVRMTVPGLGCPSDLPLNKPIFSLRTSTQNYDLGCILMLLIPYGNSSMTPASM